MTAIDQLERIKQAQTLWSDNAVSSTVTYKPEELSEIKDWLKVNYEKGIKSVSFLLYSDHGFTYAPLEAIDETTYHKMVKKLDFSIPLEDRGTVLLEDDCATGACPVR